MATTQGMSGIDIMALVEELNALLPLWIGKVYQYDATHIGVRLGRKGYTKLLMLIESGRRIHPVHSLPTPPMNPTGFAMLLRKYLEGGKILSIGQYGVQRVLYFDIGKKNQTFRLCVELFDEGNVILCQDDGTIIMPLRQHRFRDREIVKGAPYTISGRDCREISDTELQSLFQKNEKELVKTLAVDCMLGGQYAEEVCRMAGIPKQTPTNRANAGLVQTTIRALFESVRNQRTPVITKTGCWPVILGRELPLQTFSTFIDALEAFYAESSSGVAPAGPPKPKRHSIQEQQLRAIAQFETQIAALQRKVDAIYENYHRIDGIQRALRQARERFSWQEIEAKLREGSTDEARIISKLNPDTASIELDVGEDVIIYIDESIDANIARYFDQIKKIKRKRTGAQNALTKPIMEKEASRAEVPSQKKRWFHRFRWFYTTDGVLVVGGKDAAQNEELVKRYMEGKDTFFHAEVHGASAVIVKGATMYPLEAAQFAVSYSGAWKSGHFSADVYSAQPDQVSKAAPSGEYVARGSFMVRGDRTYYRDVPLAVSIGVITRPEISVIGGPPSAVIPKSHISVTIRPGQFEPNDMAKKVVRILKERLESKGIHGLRRILTTNTVAPFIPSGGSDLVEAYES